MEQFVQSESSSRPRTPEATTLTEEANFVFEPFLCQFFHASDLKYLGHLNGAHQFVFASCIHHLMEWSATCWTGEDEAERIGDPSVIVFVLKRVDDEPGLPLRQLLLELLRRNAIELVFENNPVIVCIDLHNDGRVTMALPEPELLHPLDQIIIHLTNHQ